MMLSQYTFTSHKQEEYERLDEDIIGKLNLKYWKEFTTSCDGLRNNCRRHYYEEIVAEVKPYISMFKSLDSVSASTALTQPERQKLLKKCITPEENKKSYLAVLIEVQGKLSAIQINALLEYYQDKEWIKHICALFEMVTNFIALYCKITKPVNFDKPDGPRKLYCASEYYNSEASKMINLKYSTIPLKEKKRNNLLTTSWNFSSEEILEVLKLV